MLRKKLLPALVGLACANTYANTASIELEEVLVSGENIERRLLDSNASVSVLSDEDLKKSVVTNIQDIFRRTASVVSTGTGIQSFDFSIRGVSTDGVGGAGQEGLATIIIDDANTTRVQSARGISSLFDIEKVEILRGPQSTSQGKNSLAGAVIVTTKKPEFDFNTSLRADYGNYNTSQLSLAHTGPISEEFAYRIVLDRQATDGYYENTALNRDDYNEGETLTARAKLLYASKSIPLEVLLSYTNLNSDQNNDMDSYDVENRRFVTANPYTESNMDTKQELTTLHLDYAFSDTFKLKSITTYNDFESKDQNNPFALSVPTEEQAWKAFIDQKEFTQELRLNFVTESVNGVVGLYYSDYEELNTRDGIGLVGFGGQPVNIDIDFNSPTKN